MLYAAGGFMQMYKQKGLTMEPQERKLKISTAIGIVEYGEFVKIEIPEDKRHYKVQKQNITIPREVILIPAGIEKDEDNNFYLTYVASFRTGSFIFFERNKQISNAPSILNGICSQVFLKEGVEAKAIGIEELKPRLKNGKIAGILLFGSHWIASTFVKKQENENKIYGIYSLEDRVLKEVEMYDDAGMIKQGRVGKRILAFVKAKIDMDDSRKLLI